METPELRARGGGTGEPAACSHSGTSPKSEKRICTRLPTEIFFLCIWKFFHSDGFWAGEASCRAGGGGGAVRGRLSASTRSPEFDGWVARTERPFLPPQTPSKPGRVASGRSSALLSLPLPAPHKGLHPGRTSWRLRGPHSETVPHPVPCGLTPPPGVKTEWAAGATHTLAVGLSQESLAATAHACRGLRGRSYAMM